MGYSDLDRRYLAVYRSSKSSEQSGYQDVRNGGIPGQEERERKIGDEGLQEEAEGRQGDGLEAAGKDSKED